MLTFPLHQWRALKFVVSGEWQRLFAKLPADPVPRTSGLDRIGGTLSQSALARQVSCGQASACLMLREGPQHVEFFPTPTWRSAVEPSR